MQVAAAQPDEHAGGTRVVALALQRVEDFVNFPHQFSVYSLQFTVFS